MNELNSKIDTDFSIHICNELSDSNLLNEYKKTKSVKNKINKLYEIINIYVKDKDIINKIINDYFSELIPAGTKGIIRGIKFNNIIKEYINKLDLDKNIFNIEFEKNIIYYKTDEIPDWTIYNKLTNKILIGMNQLDLISGGHQLNRGYKYIMNQINDKNIKIICVICNYIQFKNNKTKAYKLYDYGFSNNNLCYLNNLSNIIYNYFDIKES
jgi:hypothetical protein